MKTFNDFTAGSAPQLTDELVGKSGSAKGAERRWTFTTLKAWNDTLWVKRTEMGAASGVATLDSGGKVPLAQMPATSITDTFVVSSQAAMLALTAQTGDVAVRTDVNLTYILQGSDPTVLGNWVQLVNTGGLLLQSNNLSDLANKATARTNLGVAIGTDVQAYSATLAAVAAGTYTGATSITTLGVITAGTWQGTAIANAYLANSTIGIAGTSVALGGSIVLDTITGVSSGGIVARTAANTLTPRTITGTAGNVAVSNGDGVSGNPTLSLPTALTSINSITAVSATALTLSGGATSGNVVINTNGSTLAATFSGANTALAGTLTVNVISSAAGSNLALGTGTFGTALTFANTTGNATFNGTVTSGGDIQFPSGSVVKSTGIAFFDSASATSVQLRPGGTVALTLAPTTLAATFAGSLTVSGSGIHTFGPTNSGAYFYQDTLGFDSGTNATAVGNINYYGYANGTTQFRDLQISDGKGASVLYLTGSTKAASFAGGVTVSGSILGSGGSAPTNTTSGSNQFTAGIATNGPAYIAGLLNVGGNIQLNADGSSTFGTRLTFANGSQNLAAWGTLGAVLAGATGKFVNDTTSSGTVAAAVMVSIPQIDLRATSATTYTDASSFYVAGAPTQGTNTTLTNAWAAYLNGKVRVASDLYLSSNNSFVYGGNSGGTWSKLLGVNASNVAQFGDLGNNFSGGAAILAAGGTQIAVTGSLVTITPATSITGQLTLTNTAGLQLGSAAFSSGRAITLTTPSGNTVGIRYLQSSVADWLVGNTATTGAFEVLENGTTARLSILSASTTITNTLILNTYGTGSGTVSVGAADSGGSGFKLLRVPN